jgi:type IV secretion system protein VirB6
MNLMISFTSMYAYIASAISTAVAGFGAGLVSWVAAPLGIAATIYFLLLGFAVLRGAIQAPLRELVFQAGKVGFVIAAASSIGYSAFVVNIVTNLPNEIIAAGSGTAVSNPGTTFDKYVSDTNKLAQIIDAANQTVQNQASLPIDVATALTKFQSEVVSSICIMILYIFAAISAAAGFCIVIFAQLAVSICVALAPLALACLLFNSSRWLFDGWLKQTVNYVLLMVIMAIMTLFITAMEQSTFTSILAAAGNASAFVSAGGSTTLLNSSAVEMATLAGILIYIVGTIFFFQSPSIAAGIAGGASSGGHAFLQTGMNMAANRLIFRRAGGAGGARPPAAAGGAVRGEP